MPDRSPPRPPRRSARGVWVLLAVFLFGGLFLAGLYLTAYLDVPAEYRRSSVGVPARAVRLAYLNADWSSAELPELSRALSAETVDLVLICRISRADAQELGRALDLRHEGELQMVYSPTNPGTRELPGNAILSWHLLAKGRSMSAKSPAGVWAEAVIDGRRFLVGCVDAGDAEAVREMHASLQKVGRVPFVVAGIGLPDGMRPDDSNSPSSRETGAELSLLHSGEWHIEARSTTRPTGGSRIDLVRLEQSHR